MQWEYLPVEVDVAAPEEASAGYLEPQMADRQYGTGFPTDLEAHRLEEPEQLRP